MEVGAPLERTRDKLRERARAIIKRCPELEYYFDPTLRDIASPSRRGGHQKGSAAAYSNKSARDSEREATGNAEEEYRRFVANWKQQSPKGRSGATNEVRRS